MLNFSYINYTPFTKIKYLENSKSKSVDRLENMLYTMYMLRKTKVYSPASDFFVFYGM
nr:MAG TPA: hypothetical protein [Caudoviricetes sp.]